VALELPKTALISSSLATCYASRLFGLEIELGQRFDALLPLGQTQDPENR
jgi:hypothetical protein